VAAHDIVTLNGSSCSEWFGGCLSQGNYKKDECVTYVISNGCSVGAMPTSSGFQVGPTLKLLSVPLSVYYIDSIKAYDIVLDRPPQSLSHPHACLLLRHHGLPLLQCFKGGDGNTAPGAMAEARAIGALEVDAGSPSDGSVESVDGPG